MDSNVLWAFMLTMFGGLATGVGGAIVLFTKQTNKKFLAASLGFAAGVMIFISMTEILGGSEEFFVEAAFDDSTAMLLAVGSFLGGIIVMAILDKLLPSHHDFPADSLQDKKVVEDAELKRTGVFTAWAVAIHNFPEGLLVFLAALVDLSLAIPIVVAIAIHNIPEGVAIAAPIYYATGSKAKAFWYATVSGLAEPLGAIIGYLILRPFLTDTVLGVAFGAVAGMMLYISIDELLPAARAYVKDHHISLYGLIAGMAVMALSIWLMY